MTIRGLGFTSALDTASQCTVLIDGATPVSKKPTTLTSGVDQLTVDVPANAPVGGNTNVKVQTPRLTTSDPVQISFQA